VTPDKPIKNKQQDLNLCLLFLRHESVEPYVQLLLRAGPQPADIFGGGKIIVTIFGGRVKMIETCCFTKQLNMSFKIWGRGQLPAPPTLVAGLAASNLICHPSRNSHHSPIADALRVCCLATSE